MSHHTKDVNNEATDGHVVELDQISINEKNKTIEEDNIDNHDDATLNDVARTEPSRRRGQDNHQRAWSWRDDASRTTAFRS